MTTFQDPPPQSRRSARQSERDEPTETVAGPASETGDFSPIINPVEPASPGVPASTVTDPGEAPLTRSGRRAREAAQQGLRDVPPATGGEPLEYMTQGRDEPLSYQAPEPQVAPAPRVEAQPAAEPVAPAPAAASPASAASPAAAAEPTTPQFRVRDFSPEGRATGRRAAPPPLIEPGSAPAGPPSDLEYRTEVGPGAVNIPAAEAVSPPAPPVVAPAPASAPIVAEEPQQQTLTRREMRQRIADDAGESAQPNPSLVTGAQPPVSPALVTGAQPPVTPSLVTGAQPPFAPSPVTAPQPPQSASLLTGSQPPPPANPSLLTGSQPPPPTASPTAATPPAAPPLMPPPPPPPAAASSVSDAMLEFEALSRSGQLAPPSAAQRVTETNAVPAAAPPAAPAAPASSSFADTELDAEIEHTGGWVAPVGHWSRQADLDDETQPWENTVTREVGGGNVATTTSALVLPEMPRANPFPTALNATGEVLLTGSIDLPRSLSSVGGDSRHFDDSDVDLMYDDKEREFSGTDSSPVSAIRAVSTHTSARGVISSANKPHGNRMLTVLLITAAVMAVGVVALLIAGLAGEFF